MAYPRNIMRLGFPICGIKSRRRRHRDAAPRSEAAMVEPNGRRRPKYSRAALLAEVSQHVDLLDLRDWTQMKPVGWEIF